MTYPTFGRIVRDDPRLDALIPRDARIEVLASGFEWTEGPVWIKDGGYLLFSDIPRNSIMKWKEGVGISLVHEAVRLHRRGRLRPRAGQQRPDCSIRRAASSAASTATAASPGWSQDGGKRTLVDNYKGKRLNSPNDAVFKSNGDLYFTDPPYGLPENRPTIRAASSISAASTGCRRTAN